MEQQVHTIILGAGTSGLAAGYTLADAGHAPVLIERDKVAGGLFQSIKRGDFVVDVGRKELYNRIERVDTFWNSLLGSDYREYPHRGGILFDGHVIDLSPAFQGFTRGMPLSLLAGCAIDLLGAQLRRSSEPARNLEAYFYAQRGRRMTQVFAQGFQEKLIGKRWRDVPMPAETVSATSRSLVETATQLFDRAFSRREVNTHAGIWRHPARGTGQICDLLAKGIQERGGTIQYQSSLVDVSAADGKTIDAVTVDVGGERTVYRPQHVVSSVPVDLLLRFLRKTPPAPATEAKPAAAPRTVVLVYLFMDRPVRFPHAWLQVTCPSTRIGRITNYSGFNGEMVPPGKGCVCCEYYCFGADPLLDLSKDDLVARTAADCARAGLIEPSSVVDQLVIKLPGADASQNRDNWLSPERLRMMAELATYPNLFYVNRTETDIATLAGIEAAEAIMSGDRRAFDERIDPARLQIRSESKAFSFDSPVPVR
jgi:protoporphyrinogen oxidase